METLTMTNAELKSKTEAVERTGGKPNPMPKKAETVPMRAPKTIPGFITGFAKNTLRSMVKKGNYSIRKENGIETLIYTSYERKYDSGVGKGVKTSVGEEKLAVRLKDGTVLSNANQLRYCGTHAIYGAGRTSNFGQAIVQQFLEQAGAVPVPFSVFEDAKLNIAHAKVTMKAPGESISVRKDRWVRFRWIKRNEKTHYVGACLIEVEGSFFLFDIDREDLKYKLFNPFLAKLPGAVATVEEAYLSLKPAKVAAAELEGKPVERQGKWFFVKKFDELPELPQPPRKLVEQVDNPPDARKMGATVPRGYMPGDYVSFLEDDSRLERAYDKALDKWHKAQEKLRRYQPIEGSLRHGENETNTVDEFIRHDGMTLVSGTVFHNGKEHRDIYLQGWWEVVPNTAVESWEIIGDAD